MVAEDQALQIIIADDGCGIKTVNHEDIFKPFIRLDKSRTRENGGFGLGLAIVKRIIEWHQGHCVVGSSTALGGAEFTLVLPRVSTA